MPISCLGTCWSGGPIPHSGYSDPQLVGVAWTAHPHVRAGVPVEPGGRDAPGDRHRPERPTWSAGSRRGSAAGLPIVGRPASTVGVRVHPRSRVSDAAHWDEAYDRLGPTGVSWFQRSPEISRRLVARLGRLVRCADPRRRRRRVRPGGRAARRRRGRRVGSRPLRDRLRGCAGTARRRKRNRSGGSMPDVRAMGSPIAPTRSGMTERVPFHGHASRHRGIRARRPVGDRSRGYLVLGTFAADGPARCSGLPVARYAPDDLAVTVDGFSLIASEREEHRTPGGAVQAFTWVTLRRDVGRRSPTVMTAS